MTETNIFKFRNWIYTKKIPNLEMEIRYIHFEEGETRTKSIIVDLTNKKYVGRFTIWEDNSCVMELIDIESENNILFDRFEFSEFDNFKAKYNELQSFFT